MLTVRVGSSNATSGGDVLQVSEIFFHPNYKPQTLEFNIAVLRLHKNLTFGKEHLSVDAIEYSRDNVVPVDNNILFLGWGSVLVREIVILFRVTGSFMVDRFDQRQISLLLFYFSSKAALPTRNSMRSARKAKKITFSAIILNIPLEQKPVPA